MKRFLHTSLLIILSLTWASHKSNAQSCVPINNCSSDADILLNCPDIPAWTDHFWDVRELGRESDPLATIPELIRKDGSDYYFTPSGVTDALSGVQVSVVLVEGTSNASSLGHFAKRVRVFKSPETYALTGPNEVCISELFTLQLADSESSTTSYALWGGLVGGTANELTVINGQNGSINFDQTNFTAGDYNYYVVADGGQCSSTMPDPDPDNGWKVKVNDVPTVVLSSDQAGNEFCQGTDVTFTAIGANEYAFYLNSTANEVQARSADNTYNTTTLNDGDVIIVEGYDTATSAITTCTATDDITVIVNDLPTGDISGDNTICDGETTVLTFALTGVAPWDIVYTDGTTDYNVTANTTPFNHTITPAAGVTTYTIKTLTDSKACGAATLTGSATITVNDRPSSTITGGGTICDGESVTFDITMTGTGPFTVTYSDGTTDVTLTNVPSPQTVTVNPSVTSTYFVKALVDQNCSAQVADMPGSVTVDVNPRPTSTIAGGGTICNGETATFDISMTGAGPFTVTYSDGTTDVTLTDVASPQTVTVNPAVTTTYFVKALVDQNCTAQAGDMPESVTVDVNPRPTSVVSGGGTICNGESSTFDITMSGTGPFTVTYTDGTTPVTLTNVTSPQTITVSPSSTTTYTVTALSDAVCAAQAVDMTGSATVNVNPRPTSAITGGGIICDGGSTTFDIVMTGTGPFTVTYTDGTTPVTLTNVASPQTITVNPSVTTTYSVIALSDAVCTAQAGDMPGSVTVDVNARPTSTITGGGTICDGDNATFTINMTGTGPFTVTYTDGVTPVTLTDVASPQVITVNPSSDATYSVIALSDQSCSADALAGDMPGSVNVIVNNRPTGTISGGGTICLGDSETFDIVMTGTGPFTVTYTDGTTPVTLTNVASPQTITVTPGSTTNYTLVSLTDALCTAVPATDLSGTAVVTVNNVTANISVSAPVAGGTEICAGTTVVFNAAGVGGSGNYNYDFHRVRGASDVSVQNSTTATYSDGALQDGDVIYVIVTDITTTCFDQSADITMTVNANPVVTLNITNPASGSSTVCIGTNVEFTATSGYNTYDFYLNGGLVQSSISNTYSNNTLATGDQIFVEAAQGSCRGSSVPPIVMTVNNLPTPTLVSDQAGNIACPAEEVTFTAGGGVLYEFFVNGVSQGAAAATTEFKYIHPINTAYNVTVIVTDANNCIATSAPLTITFDPATAGLSADKTTICAGEDVTFTATGGLLYEFFVGGGTVQGPGAADVYIASGLTDGQVVSVEVTNSSGCTDTHAGIAITVTPLPIAGISSSDVDNIICAGDEVTFTGSGGAWYEFFINGVSVGAGSATDTYTTSGLTDGDRVSVNVAVGPGGCSAMSAELIHTVNPLPTPGLVSDIDPATAACPGQDVTFTASGGVNYQFILDDVAQGVLDANNIFIHTTAGDFKVEVLVEDGNGCQATSAAVSITEDAATAGLTADNTTICAGDDVTFTATGGVTYEFLIDDVSQVVADPTDNNFVASGLTDGQVVKVKVTNATGCEDTHAGITISVNPLPVADITSSDADNTICDGDEVTFTGAGGDIYEFFVNGLSVGAASATNTYVTNGLADGDRVSVNVTNSATTCSQLSAELVHTVNSLPTAGISADTGPNIITGTDVTFTATGGVEYEFFKNTLLIQARSGDDTYGPVNDLVDGDIISVNVYNANDCMSTASITMSVVDGISSYDLLSSATEYCEDESGVSLYLATPQAGVSYRLIRTSDDQVINPIILFDGTNTVRWNDVTVPAALSTEEFRVEGFYPTVPGSEVEMNNRVTITRNALPTVYSIQPTGSVTGCGGGAGHEVKLANSETDVSYQLMLDGGNIGTPLDGNTGNELTFGFQTIFGEYTIMATNSTTGCSSLMSNTFTIDPDGTYTSFNVSGDGNFCIGDAGANVVLEGSEVGVEYRVIRDGIENGDNWTGDGTAHTFGPYTTEGSYSVVVNTATGCKFPMNGSVNVIEVALPKSYDLVATNNGHFCPGNVVTITISGQQNGVDYELFHNDVSIVIVTGTIDDDTAPLSFGDYGIAGTYRVEARTSGVVCSAPMNNELILIEDAVPTVFNVTSDGDYCTGGTTFLHLDGSESDVQYRWEREGDLLTGPWVDGNGGILDFEITGTDTYYIVAMRKDGVTSCTREMAPRIAITEKVYADLTKVLSIKPGTGLDCAYGAVVIVEASENGVIYELVKTGTRTGNVVTGDGNDVEFPTPVLDIDATYEVYANKDGCEQALTSTIYIDVPGAMKQYAVTGSGDICNGNPGQQFGVAYGDNGINYTLYLADAPGSSSGTAQQTVVGTNSPITFNLVNNPGEYYVMADDGAGCAIEMLNRETLIVHPLPIAYQISGSGKYCSTEAGAFIKLESSEVGVEYIVQMGGIQQGTSVSGSGAELTFGPFSVAGVYTVVAYNSTTLCTSNMNGEVTIGIDADIVNFDIINTDLSFCDAEAGIDIILAGQQDGVTYQVFNLAMELKAEVVGDASGTQLSLGILPEGTYTIIASYGGDGCVTPMNSGNTVVITSNSSPLSFNVVTTEFVNICQGTTVDIELDGSENTRVYNIVDGLNNVVATATGDGNPLTIPVLCDEIGDNLYEVIAVGTPTCDLLLDVVRIEVKDAPDQPIVDPTIDLNYCWDADGVKVSLTAVEAGVDYYIVDKATGSRISFLSGDAGVLEFKESVLAGTYYVTAKSFDSGCDINSLDFLVNAYSEIQKFRMQVGTSGEGYEIIEDGEIGTGTINVDYIGLELSTVNVKYTLLQNGAPYSVDYVLDSGTGNPFVYNNTLPDGGIYTILAEENGCSRIMAGSVNIFEKPLEAIDDILPVTYGKNQGDTNVWVNDISLSSIDINVGPSKNIYFKLLDCDEDIDLDELVPWDSEAPLPKHTKDRNGNDMNLVEVYADGKVVFTKLPSFYGRDSIDYVVYNTDYLGSNRYDRGRIYFFAGNINQGEDDILIPNAFSPNGDGFNDEFVISQFKSEPTESKLEVFNRWGTIVYRSKGKKYTENFWDGKSNAGMISLGEDLPSGTYFYVFKVDVSVDNKDTGSTETVSKEYSGFIELRR